MPNPQVNIKFPHELHTRLEAEAEHVGKTKAEVARAIVEEHFAGNSVRSLRADLSELSRSVDRLKERLGQPNEKPDSTPNAMLEERIDTVQESVQLLSAAVHYAMNTFFAQTKPSPDQAKQVLTRFEALKAHYLGRE